MRSKIGLFDFYFRQWWDYSPIHNSLHATYLRMFCCTMLAFFKSCEVSKKVQSFSERISLVSQFSAKWLCVVTLDDGELIINILEKLTRNIKNKISLTVWFYILNTYSADLFFCNFSQSNEFINIKYIVLLFITMTVSGNYNKIFFRPNPDNVIQILYDFNR